MKKKIFLFSLVCAITLILVSAFNLNANGAIAYADSDPTSYSIEELCELYTNSDYLYDIENDTLLSYSVQDYNLVLRQMGVQPAPYSKDSMIKYIIPKELFSYENNTTYIGKEYGFYINTYDFLGDLKSEVYVFDITTTLVLANIVTYKIEPLFEDYFVSMFKADYPQSIWDEYVIDNDLDHIVNTISIYNIPSDDRFYLQNIGFGFTVMNENNLNDGDSGYTMEDDLGSIINYTNYEFQGRTFDDDNVLLETVEFAARRFIGFVPVVGPGKESNANQFNKQNNNVR